MKTLLYLVLSIAGFGVAGAMAYFLNPNFLDRVGFGIFYSSLGIGSLNLFLLLRLSGLQSMLLSSLFITFLLLQHLRVFTIWIGLILVMLVIFIEHYATRKNN